MFLKEDSQSTIAAKPSQTIPIDKCLKLLNTTMNVININDWIENQKDMSSEEKTLPNGYFLKIFSACVWFRILTIKL